ncbi:MAG: ABC transporter substrate-binding protein [Actinomycetota bacterium]
MKVLPRAGLAGLFICAATLFAACSSSNSATETTVVVETTVVEAAYPVTAGGVTLEAQPMRIVSLSPTHTEMLYAIGAGDQVVAVDEYSNYPAEAVALGTKLSGFEPNIEAIAEYEPDFVVASYDPGNLVEQLNSLAIPVYVAGGASSLEQAYEQIEQLGALTGNSESATQLTTRMKDEIASAIAAVGVLSRPVSYFYELDDTYYSVTSNTFVGQIFKLFGLENIADGVEAGNDYPQLSSEVIVASDPDLIFLADTKCCGQTSETVSARDGWQKMGAVVNKRIIELDDDVASRWGPRIVELVTSIGKGLSLVEVGS